MKKIILTFSFLILTTACQQAQNNNAIEPETTQSPNDAVKVKDIVTNTTCNEKYSFIQHSKDDIQSVFLHETENYFSITTKFIKQNEDGFRMQEASGSIYIIENVTQPDATQKKSTLADYVFKGTRSTKITKLKNNTFIREDRRKETQTGRNGFKLRNSKGESVDSREVDVSRKHTYFDDGKETYTISLIVNEKDVTANNLDTLTKYSEVTEFGKIIYTSKASLRSPFIKKDENGKVVSEIYDYTEDCSSQSFQQ